MVVGVAVRMAVRELGMSMVVREGQIQLLIMVEEGGGQG